MIYDIYIYRYIATVIYRFAPLKSWLSVGYSHVYRSLRHIVCKGKYCHADFEYQRSQR